MSSEIKANKISPATGTAFTLGDSGDTFTVPSGTTLDIASGATLDTTGATVSGLTTGKVLQVVQAVKTDTFSYAGTTFADVTGLSVSITPSATSSKILIFSTINGAANFRYSGIRLVRDSTDIFIGDAAGSRTRVTIPIDSNSDEPSNSYVSRNMGFNYLDSPSTTSATTYKIQVAIAYSASYTTYINTNADDSDANFTLRSASNIIAMEIGA